MCSRPLVAGALALGLAGLAHAQATVKPDGQMRAAIGLGASVASGNSKSSNLSLQADAVRATDQDKTTLYASALRASANGDTTAEQFRLGGRQDRNFGPVWFGYGGLDFERNKFANLKSRAQIQGGLGLHAVKTDTTTWDLMGGLAYTADRFVDATVIDGRSRTRYGYASLVLAEESTHKLSDTTSAKQRLALYPNLSNTGEFRATWDAGLAVAMTRTLSLNVGLAVTHNSEPGAGRKSTDTLFTTGVSMKFE